MLAFVTCRALRQVLRQRAPYPLSDERRAQPAWIAGDEELCEASSEPERIATLSMPRLRIEFHAEDASSEQLCAFGLPGRESKGPSCSACGTRLSPGLLDNVFRQISVQHRSMERSTRIHRAYFLLPAAVRCASQGLVLPERLAVAKAALCALVTLDLPVRCLQRACLPDLQLSGAVWLRFNGRHLDPYAFLDLLRAGRVKKRAASSASSIRSVTCDLEPGNKQLLSFVLKQVLVELLGMRMAWQAGSLGRWTLPKRKCHCSRSCGAFTSNRLIRLKLKLRKYDLLRLLSVGRKCSVQFRVWVEKRSMKPDDLGVSQFSELQCMAHGMPSARSSGQIKPCKVKSASCLQKGGLALGCTVLMASWAPVDCGFFALICALDVRRQSACASCVAGQSRKPVAWKLPLISLEQVFIIVAEMYISSRTGYLLERFVEPTV